MTRDEMASKPATPTPASSESASSEPASLQVSPWMARFIDGIAVYLKARVLIVMFLGFSSGLPLALSGSTLLVRMAESQVDLRTIGLFAFAGTPYTIKFLWAPLVDALNAPFFSKRLGRRRGWLIFSQILLMIAIVFLGAINPTLSPLLVALGAVLVATASATQDIVVDAFRVESLDESEQAAGMASYVAAYRIGMLVSGAGALYLVSLFEWLGFGKQPAWTGSFSVMAVLVVIGMIVTLLATEPTTSKAAPVHTEENPLKRVFEASRGAFADFFSRDMAFAALAFIILFKFTDALAGIMTGPFVIDIGFSRTDYANIIKGVGLIASLAGGFAGGFLARTYPLTTCLWVGGILQAVANLGFSWQATVGADLAALTVAITLENFTSAIGTVIFVAYLSALCRNPLHTATQYALLTALSAIGRTYLSAGAGYIVKATGWPWFFAICMFAAIPSLLLLVWLQACGHFKDLSTSKAT